MELLVVITIIGILIALLLPAVQTAREAARRMQCGNHLKQIGLALHNYHSVYDRLPMGSAGNGAGSPGYYTGGTWAAFILPYLERKTIYDMFNFNYAMNASVNSRAVTTIVSTYTCPSDPDSTSPVFSNRTSMGGAYENPTRALGLWYPGSMGPTQMDVCPYCPDSTPKPGNWCCQGWNFGSYPGGGYPEGSFVGMFGRYYRGVRFADVSDGLSNTIMVGETIPGHCLWISAYAVNFCTVSTNIPINTMEREDNPNALGNYYRACGFKSYHPGGANFAMADGNVRFFGETIDFTLFNQLGTRNGGEPVTTPD